MYISSWKRRFGNRVGETDEPGDPLNPVGGLPLNKVTLDLLSNILFKTKVAYDLILIE